MTERFTCTPTDSWTREKGSRVFHPDAREVGDQESGYPGGDIVTLECPNCRHRWQAELPQ